MLLQRLIRRQLEARPRETEDRRIIKPLYAVWFILHVIAITLFLAWDSAESHEEVFIEIKERPFNKIYRYRRQPCDDYTLKPGDKVTFKPHDGGKGCVRKIEHKGEFGWEKSIGVIHRVWKKYERK